MSSHLEKQNESRFPIVGIGASAGGLQAFTGLLQHLPPDTGMGFVLVQHLAHGHESALTRILSRTTSMPVYEAVDNLSVEPNRILCHPAKPSPNHRHETLEATPAFQADRSAAHD